ncbi:MAG: hypothetical protein JWP08_378, partial [Bryobacterales bacterium]|nr:hypothetical protein [Bryobacterales bacterium]
MHDRSNAVGDVALSEAYLEGTRAYAAPAALGMDTGPGTEAKVAARPFDVAKAFRACPWEWTGLEPGTRLSAIATTALVGVQLISLIGAVIWLQPFASSVACILLAVAMISAIVLFAIDSSMLVLALLTPEARWHLAERTASNANRADPVAVPTIVPLLVRSTNDIDAAIKCIQDNWEFERSVGIPIILLVDFQDAEKPELPGDYSLRAELEDRLATLNRSRLRHGRPIAAALYRSRKWNAYEHRWMGWERKRGKVLEFLRFTRDQPTSFVGACPERWRGATFVFVMDVDSRVRAPDVLHLAQMLSDLRIKAAQRHPPAVLSPYVDTLDLVEEPFERWLSQPTVFRGTTDWREARLRQALFGTDIYNGKAMLHVDDFLDLSSMIGENTVLSHDHLEAILGNGCSTDLISVYEPFPKSRIDWERRQHRWVRGDMQILPWVVTRRCLPGGKKLNLKQRLAVGHVVLNAASPVFAYLSVCVAFAAGPKWGLLTLTAIVLAQRENVVLSIMQIPRFSGGGRVRRGWARAALYVGANGFLRSVGSLTFFQRNAILTFDATRVALWRMAKGKSGLLEWYPDEPTAVLRVRRTFEFLIFVMALS